MSDDPNKNVMDYLRAQFDRTNAKIDGMREDLAEVKQRLTALEIQVGNQVATEQSHYAQVMLRMDRHDARLDRIERRLDLVEAL
jgi:division protein CdvB (Snf7/Vps24/ESCRT-III family)